MTDIDYRELPDRWWVLYRQERRKLALARKPGVKRPSSVVLSAPEITRAAREANRRWKEERAKK